MSSVPGDRSERMGHPRQGSGIQEGAYGQTERLGHGATRSTGSHLKIVTRTLSC
jgi:hypothetical protein